MVVTWLALILLTSVGRFGIEAHVAWLFPAPREPAFDSLNFDQNTQPCGGVASKENDHQDIFIVDREYNLTWRTQYFHSGGMQINLLSPNGTKLTRLKPHENESVEFFDTEMNQPQEIGVTFDAPCKSCIIQLLKQAQDLNPNFLYVSCADVEILSEEEEGVRRNDETECQSNGQWKSNNQCECDETHEGQFCERNVDCKVDSDCGPGGVCFDQPNSMQSKVCYCAYGRLGRRCADVSTMDPEDKCFNAKGLESENRIDYVSYGLFDEGCYKQTALADNDFVYSRVVGSELEIILDFDTLSYAAIGWRPLEIAVECREFPNTGTEHGGFLERASNTPLHPMACIDMIWGSVINDTRLNIQDGYSRDRHTPLVDEKLGGQNSITSAFGVQIVDRTVIMFRRLITTQDPTDHTLGPGPLFGVYAKGQVKDERRWIANQTLAQNPNRVFYRQDELSYHADNRGLVTFEFFKEHTDELNSAITNRLTRVLLAGMLTYLTVLLIK